MVSFEMLDEILADIGIKFFYKHQSPKVNNNFTKFLYLEKKTNLDEKKGTLEKYLENYQSFSFFAYCFIEV
jgi:hypothetical protein